MNRLAYKSLSHQVIFVIAMFLLQSCTKEENLLDYTFSDLLGPVVFIDSLEMSSDTFDFNELSTLSFTASWKFDSEYELIIEGLESKTIKSYTGIGTSINEQWEGRGNDIPQFVDEECSVKLNFPRKPDDNLETSLTLKNTFDYQATSDSLILIEGFKGADSIPLLNIPSFYTAQYEYSTDLGTQCHVFHHAPVVGVDVAYGWGGYQDFFIDETLLNNLLSTATGNDDIYLNLYVYVTEEDNVGAVRIGVYDEDGVLPDNNFPDEFHFKDVAIEPEDNWQLISIKYSDLDGFSVTNNNDGAQVDGIKTYTNITRFRLDYILDDKDQEATFRVANYTITVGEPFSYAL